MEGTRESDGAPGRIRIRVTGTVQGVGFRPHVYRLATALELAGSVRNDARGVLLELEGAPDRLSRFLERLTGELPPLASVEAMEVREIVPHGEAGFRILESETEGSPSALVTPDTATCDACLAELFDPADRRHRYPFINCTDCGPRFTIVRGVPYDRPLTTMAGFRMCGPCRVEYEDPGDRRFHAQPNACPDCGPSVRLENGAGGSLVEARPGDPDGPIRRAAAELSEGRILAVKGLGGYHLACRADDAEAVGLLRSRKHREEKPFALMARDLRAARRLVELDGLEEAILTDRVRPILLARRRPEAPVAGAVAPGRRELGVMLPYTPLHHLLLEAAGTVLVMTSGNLSDEPIAYRDREARERLAELADLFLVHDRPIHVRTDDSVVRIVSLPEGRRPLTLRRSRGYVPSPMPLPGRDAPLLACGAQLKNSFCVARDGRAWVSHHIGDLENWETHRAFWEGIEHFEALFSVRPARIAHDLHAGYLSTEYARERSRKPGGPPPVGVQHHHAHLAACLAEHREEGPALGVIFDGTGAGTDGTVWGGEFLVGDRAGFERVGRLWPVRLPGGEAAIREPWRMACAWLQAALEEEGAGSDRAEPPPLPSSLSDEVDVGTWAAVARLAHTGVASPPTSSVGRLFDAVSALCGLRARVSYEGQAAVELEAAAWRGREEIREAGPGAAGGAAAGSTRRGGPTGRGYDLALLPDRAGGGGTVGPGPRPPPGEPTGGLLLDGRTAVRAVWRDLQGGLPVPEVALRFHLGLAASTAAACRRLAEREGLERIVLSGGVFQNALLLERLAALLAEADLRVLVPRRLPPNDGGVSYGQAAVAAARPA